MVTDPELPSQGHVSISIEIFDYKGVRTNIVKRSFLTSEFLLKRESGIYLDAQEMIGITAQEILSPSIKKEML